MKRLIGLGLAILLVCGLSVVSFATDVTQDVTITVAPITNEAFTITPTQAIDLGTVGVGVSTGNVSALVITNTGSITLTFQKTVWSITATNAWTMADPAAANTFLLHAQAQGTAGAWTDDAVEFSLTPQTYNDLTDASATQLSLDMSATQNLWFMLDMPTSISWADSQSIVVTIKGTSS